MGSPSERRSQEINIFRETSTKTGVALWVAQIPGIRFHSRVQKARDRQPNRQHGKQCPWLTQRGAHRGLRSMGKAQ